MRPLASLLLLILSLVLLSACGQNPVSTVDRWQAPPEGIEDLEDLEDQTPPDGVEEPDCEGCEPDEAPPDEEGPGHTPEPDDMADAQPEVAEPSLPEFDEPEPSPPFVRCDSTSSCISGTVRGRVPEPGPNEIQMAYVMTTQHTVHRYTLPPGITGREYYDYRDGPWVPRWVPLDEDGAGTFRLRVRAGDMAVVAIGGLFNRVTETFVPSSMAIERGLFLSDGQEVEVDFVLDIPMQRTLRVKFTGAEPRHPDTGDHYRALIWIDLGFEGTFRMPDRTVGLDPELLIRNLPRLEGELADATFLVWGGIYEDERELRTRSVSTLRDLTGEEGEVEMPPLMTIPSPYIPAEEGDIQGGYVEFGVGEGAQPDVWDVRLAQGRYFWQVLSPGEVNWIQLIEIELLFEEGLLAFDPEEPVWVVVRGLDLSNPDFDFDGFELNEISGDQLRGWSVNAYPVRWPLNPRDD